MTGLDAWLARLESRHPRAIELGLERVARVRDRLGVRFDCPVITVAGTNGKGSTCAYLHAMLGQAGYRVGLYTSPHLLRFNERVRLAGREADDAELVAALDAVEAARGDIGLTYFEHSTLAAFLLMQGAKLDALVLEVGLGGRLDAVNIVDPDCAVLTSVDLDHQAFLGDDREAIGFEKAGILRAGRPSVCVDAEPPASLMAHARALGVEPLRLGAGIEIQADATTWTCRVADAVFAALPWPALRGRHQLRNAAAAIAALWTLRARLPVAVAALRAGLATARLAGRFQVLGQAPLRVVDVAHNPHAARALADMLADLPPTGRVYAVFGMLADKDIDAVVECLAPRVDAWHVAPLGGPRAADLDRLTAPVRRLGLAHETHADIVAAWRAACRRAEAADTIIAFGSFLTVAEIIAALEQNG
jgi:dihydrofolate synthase/folylpolyglutamate synthase